MVRNSTASVRINELMAVPHEKRHEKGKPSNIFDHANRFTQATRDTNLTSSANSNAFDK
jgi:hypothetical protein